MCRKVIGWALLRGHRANATAHFWVPSEDARYQCLCTNRRADAKQLIDDMAVVDDYDAHCSSCRARLYEGAQ